VETYPALITAFPYIGRRVNDFAGEKISPAAAIIWIETLKLNRYHFKKIKLLTNLGKTGYLGDKVS
jgi:hypothetical protein